MQNISNEAKLELERVANTLNNDKRMSVQEVSETIKKFNETNPQDMKSEYIHDVIDKLMYYTFILRHTLNESIAFWRVRKSHKEIYNHIDKLKYPTSSIITKFGRANMPFQSLFYAASSPETAFAESRLNKNEYFHLTKYFIKKNKKIIVGIIGDIDHIRRRDKSIFGIEKSELHYKYLLSKLNEETRLKIYLVDAFFVDRLSRKGNQYEYRITSQIITELFESKISGIIYPSVEHNGGYNYAIKPNIYDEIIEPSSVKLCKNLLNYGYGIYLNGEYSKQSIIESNGVIKWEDFYQIKEDITKDINNYIDLLLKPYGISLDKIVQVLSFDSLETENFVFNFIDSEKKKNSITIDKKLYTILSKEFQFFKSTL